MQVMQLLPKMNLGGVERGVYDLAVYFKDTQINNVIVSGGGPLADQLREEGISIYNLPVYKKSPLVLACINKLREIIEYQEIDLIHARSRVPAWIGFIASRITGKPFITTAHGLYRSRFFSQVMGWGKFVICPSEFVASYMQEKFSTPKENLIVIPRWVDLNKFNFTNYSKRLNSDIIVTIGRISPFKGYEYLIRGFKQVTSLNPLLKLYIVGAADKKKSGYLSSLKKIVKQLRLEDNVVFLGARYDIEDILSKARLLVAASIRDESFGRVIVEAQACGIPVIATDVGGYRDIIENDHTGILVPKENSQAIGEKIEKILKDDNYGLNLVINARKKVEKFYSMDNCLKEEAKVYQKTIETLRILVVKFSSLGDIILIIPTLKVLKQQFPNANISLLTQEKYSALLKDCPYLDKIIIVNDNYKKWRNISSLAGKLRRQGFDYIIDLQNSRSSHLLAFLSFPRDSFGFSLRWGKLLKHKTDYKLSDDPLTSQERILNLLGVNMPEKKLDFWPIKDITNLSLPQNKLIGINIAASYRWQSKNWPIENINQLIALILTDYPNYKIALLGDKYAVTKAKDISDSYQDKIINLVGRTSLDQLPQVIKKLSLFISPDTATLHLAIALNIPTIALFGPTDPNRHSVKSGDLNTLYKTLDCSFCYNSNCKKYPISKCMQDITPKEVFLKLKEIIR